MTTRQSAHPFDPTTTAYRVNNAYWLAKASNVAYEKPDDVEPEAAKLGLDRFHSLNNGGTEGYIGANERVIIVAFRGTEPTELQDLLADARLHKVAGPMGQMHRGFLRAFDLVKEDMLKTITEFRDKENPQSLWCTGHSLGAALAVVAVAHLLKEGHSVDGLYNFGQPRVGDDDFAEEFGRTFGKRHFRFVNNNDAVTRVPPRSFGYSHTGELRYIDTSGQIEEDMGSWYRFLDRVKGRWEDFLTPGTDGLKDHMMSRYEKHIENALEPAAKESGA